MPSASDGERILSAAQSDVGRTRTENQDAFGEFSTSAGERLFIVADGMGGHRGGATASRLCVETVGRAFADGSESAEERLRIGLELANARIHAAAASDSELGGMGTTAVALVLAPDGTGALGWVGDSRAYRFSGGSFARLSTDHSVVGEMVRAGVITEEEAETHPRRNELLRAIGPHDSVEPETLVLRHNPGDRFLLCSDGLWGPVPEAEIAIVLGYEAPDLAVKKLIAMANERGGPDNVTAQIASIADPSAAVLPAVVIASPPSVSASKSRTLPLLAAGAGVAAAALIALAVFGLRQDVERAAPAAATAQATVPVEPRSPSNEEPRPEAPPAPIEVAASQAQPAKTKPAQPVPRAQPAKPSPSAPLTPAAKPTSKQKVAAPEASAAPAKSAPAKPAPPKPAIAKPAIAKPSPAAAPTAEKVAPEPVVAKPAAVPIPVPETAVPAPSAEAPPVEASATVPEAPPVEASATAPEAPVQAAVSGSLSRELVERFLADWQTAISSKDFALYSSLGLPGDEQSFQSHYVENQARIEFALRDFDQSDPDKLVVRVQMVLETQDPSGTRRVDEERSFIVKQAPSGLRYVGLAKP